MKAHTSGGNHITVEFEDESELRAEYESNISAGGLCFPASERIPEFTPVQLTLQLGPNRITAQATVVRLMEGAIAVSIDGQPELIRAALTDAPPSAEPLPRQPEQNIWERVRSLTRTERLLLAPKADRTERAVLGQDNDAQVLYSLLKNPRITLDEVVRLSRSPLLTLAMADLIAKTAQWSSSPEIRAALVNNPRTPTTLALKLLPTLPEPEIRQVAKAAAVSQQLKQAALRIVINRK